MHYLDVSFVIALSSLLMSLIPIHSSAYTPAMCGYWFHLLGGGFYFKLTLGRPSHSSWAVIRKLRSCSCNDRCLRVLPERVLYRNGRSSSLRCMWVCFQNIVIILSASFQVSPRDLSRWVRSVLTAMIRNSGTKAAISTLPGFIQLWFHEGR